MQPTPRKNNKTTQKMIILEMLAKLPQSEQVEVYRHLGQRLKNTTARSLIKKKSGGNEVDFLKTELGRYVLEEADASIPIEKVREALSSIKGNWAKDIIADREERY